MDILSSILFALGFIGGIAAFTMAFALKSSQKALKISLLCGAICVIMVIVGYIIMPKYPSSSSSSGSSSSSSNYEKCSICGKKVFAGKLCEDCFNDWADGY